MKKIYLAMVFMSTFISGIILSNSIDMRAKFDYYIHPNCVRWGEETLKRRLFKIEDIERFRRREVVSKNPKYRYDQTGRIVFFEMVGRNKFLMAIYFGNGAEDEKSSLNFIDKDDFEKNYLVID